MPQWEEVRLAIALNGGVSLAVWMGGCVVELDAARRAHLGPEQLDEDSRERSLYHRLCNALGRRLVIDVMAGSSAGGINAALLGAATAAGRRLHPDFVRERWVELGDLGTLIHELANPEPGSLLQGERFHTHLEDVFASIMGETGDLRNAMPTGQEGGVFPVPRVEITTTDLAGEPANFTDDWGMELGAREYRARFGFRLEDDYTPGRLADAARSSASFPGAFEPWPPGSGALSLAGLGSARWTIDGGLLNNEPIATALDLIPRQPAVGRVRRVLCYLNPDPAEDEDAMSFMIPTLDPGPDDGPAAPVSAAPAIDGVLGRSLKILRAADFIDHLRAIERAVTQPSFEERELPLLTMDLAALEATAAALLPVYRRERARGSVEELTGAPPDAAELEAQAVGGEGILPWLPSAEQLADGVWSLGVRAAQRALHLGADLLRHHVGEPGEDAPGEPGPEPPLAAAELDELIAALDDTYQDLVTAPGLEAPLEVGPEAAQALFSPYEADALSALYAGAAELRAALTALPVGEAGPLVDALFGGAGEGAFGAREFAHFVRRMGAIEIVRRAFSSERLIDSSQPLGFVQLTPFVPVPILEPAGRGTPAAPEDKLTGIRLGHFAAFYRASWRVNDYMWGRLDAARRIVDMLFDGLTGAAELPGAELLAGVILPPEASDEHRWLVYEALSGSGAPPTAPALTEMLVGVIGGELDDFDAAEEAMALATTRELCARVAQLEILDDELNHLATQARKDRELRAGTDPPDISGDSTREQIESVRLLGESLPKALGRDSRAEATSDLALGTVAKSAFVSLSLIRTTFRPVGRALGVLRPALYGLTGVLSSRTGTKLAVMFGFLAACSYLGARTLATTDAAGSIDASEVFARSSLLAYFAVLFLLGFAAAPIARVIGGVQRVPNLILLAAITASTGAMVMLPEVWLLDLVGRARPPAEWLLAPGAGQIVEGWLMTIAIIVLTGLVVASLPGDRCLSWLSERLAQLFEPGWRGAASMLFLVAIALGITIPSIGVLWRSGIRGGETWTVLNGIAPILGTLAIGAVLLLTTRPWQAPGSAEEEDAQRGP
jgi:predicted acylesterase/phospholipase RssA